MSKFKVGDRVIGNNFLGKGKIPLVIEAVKKDGWYRCSVIQVPDVQLAYHEDELEKDER